MKLAAVLALALAALAAPAEAGTGIAFWDEPRHGANSFNVEPPDQEYFDALAATGATWVRLTFSKWDGEGRDFLFGDVGHYEGIPPSDLATLIEVLDRADRAGLKVVVTPLSLPGARWIQQNDDVADERLWTDFAYWDQSERFWTDLATALRDHPAVAGYNLLNEPYPERPARLDVEHTPEQIAAWRAEHRGTPRDLEAFYRRLVGAIRAVDRDTPIMLDAGIYAGPQALAAWEGPLDDPALLYAVHMYVPWTATSSPNQRDGFVRRYPGVETAFAGRTQAWDARAVASYLDLAYDWASAHGVPDSRVVVSEFGCIRRWPDCGAYLTDVLAAIEAHDGSWAFYTWRPDEWDAMDYELPASLLPGRYYWLKEQGAMDQLPRDGELMDLLRSHM